MFNNRKTTKHLEKVLDRHQTILTIVNTENRFSATWKPSVSVITTGIEGFRQWVRDGVLELADKIVYNGIELDYNQINELRYL
ncbi:MAG: hypothetical protein KC414_05505 [Romboutsia sp.]|nr:hypothetical protein [Romboutsia sp.]